MYWPLVARFITVAGYSEKMVKKIHKGDSYRPTSQFFQNYLLGEC